MKGYEIGKLFFDAQRNSKLTAEFKGDPEGVMLRYEVSEEVRAAVLRKDIRYLYEAEVPGLLLSRVVRRLLDMETSEYQAAIAGVPLPTRA